MGDFQATQMNSTSSPNGEGTNTMEGATIIVSSQAAYDGALAAGMKPRFANQKLSEEVLRAMGIQGMRNHLASNFIPASFEAEPSMEELLAIHEAAWGTGQEQTLPIYHKRMADKAAKGPFGSFRFGLVLCRNAACFRGEDGYKTFSKCSACKVCLTAPRHATPHHAAPHRATPRHNL